MTAMGRPGARRVFGGAFWPLMALVAMAPLPLASEKPWAWNGLSLIVGLLLLWWAVSVFRDPTAGRATWRRHGLTTLLACLTLGWFGVQSLPWMPQGWHHPWWRDASLSLGQPLAGSISINRAATGDALTRMIAYAGIFWLVMQLTWHTTRARQMLMVIVAAGSVFAAYGMIVQFGGYGRDWLTGGESITGAITGPFLHRNSFALYLGLCLMSALALLSSRRGADRTESIMTRRGMEQFVDSLHPETYVLSALAVVLGTALALTHSGVGVMCTVFGLSVFVVARAATRGQRLGKALTIGLVVALGGMLMIQFVGGIDLVRLAGGDLSDASRADLHGLAFRAIADAPMAGHGLGTFSDMFHIYRDGNFPWLAPAFDRAHNAYLEFAVEAGLVALLALIVIGGWLMAACVRGVVAGRRDAVFPALALAAAAVVGTQAMVDFSVQMPAVATTFAAILAAGFAQSLPTGS